MSEADRFREACAHMVATTYYHTQHHPHRPKSKRFQVVSQQGDLDRVVAEFDSEMEAADDAWRRRTELISKNLIPQGPPDLETIQKDRPHIVCLCGSTRFMDAYAEHYGRLTDEGKIVLSVGRVVPQSEQALGSARKVALDELHLRKIDLADSIFVLNVGGYIGESTKREIQYAKDHSKFIDYLEPVS